MSKIKPVKAPFQRAIPYQPETVPLATSGRIDLAIPENQAVFDFINEYSKVYNSMLHWTFRKIMEKAFHTEGQLKKAIMNKGNLKARAANAILKEARTIYVSALEVKQVQIENHNQKIKELKSEIRELEEQKNELHLSDYNWSRPPKNAVKKLHKIKSML